jgi:hypothetical protein
MKEPDAVIINQGTIFLVKLISDNAKNWWDEYVGECQFMGGFKVVEHRYMEDIAEGMTKDGLTIK